jgi:3-oxoacid CoA-transferase subunit A
MSQNRKSKLFESALEAIHDIQNGATLMVGGFGLCGIPEHLIEALRVKGVRDLTCISNNAGVDDFGLGKLLQTGQIRKMISSYVGENKIFEQQFLSGALEVDLVPQGTLAERIRAGGAGIPAFFTPTGVGTRVAEGKETRVFEDGREYVLERALRADFALIKGWRADPAGNLQYNMTAMNFNPMMASAARVTIAEVEELVGEGEMNPLAIHTPGIYVKRLLLGKNYEKRIEQRTVQPRS